MDHSDIHCMIDLETLGKEHDAAIIQVGFCIFTLTKIIAHGRWNVNWDDALKHGSVSASTLAWWMTQSDAARASVNRGERGGEGDTLEDALTQLNNAIDEHSRGLNAFRPKHYWAHATFDFPILTNAYKAVGMKEPYHFRETRDLRTLDMLAQAEFINNWPAREGTHHDAGDDALHQARCVQLMMTHVGLKAAKDIL